SDGNGSHASTLKSPSYTKSVSWQHHPVCEYADMPKEWTTTRGLYASFRYEGNWENYPDWVRNIYLIELPARGLARVNGSDIERFYYNEDFVEKDGNDVVCEIFIPVRPV
ncbi:GyrI-like domain-containing protein, partial [Escherichia coli]